METAKLLGADLEDRKLLGHPVKDWVTLIVLTIITAVLIVILAVVLPEYGGVHPCAPKAESLISRIGRTDTSLIYDRLAYLTQTFGPRQTGSNGLEQAIDWIVQRMKEDNLTVTKEPVNVAKWTRGEYEEATITLPTGAEDALPVFGFVGTVGAHHLNASVVVVESLAQVTAKAAEIKNKILVFNQAWNDSASSLEVVSKGVVEAAKVGAVACLVRSATPFSLATMHVASAHYEAGVPKIPVASITVEDAKYLGSLYKDARPFSITLNIDAHKEVNATSYNIVVELIGKKKPEEFVVIGAHLDTLDMGHGVQNSLASFVMAWEGFRVMKSYNMLPSRSLRLVGWTGSNVGHAGADEFAAKYNKDTVFAFDANRGTSTIKGLYVTAYGVEGYTTARYITGMMTTTAKAGEVIELVDQPESEIGSLIDYGVPGATFITEQGQSNFYWFSNSEADRLDTATHDELRHGGGVMAAYAYCFADMDSVVPKRGE